MSLVTFTDSPVDGRVDVGVCVCDTAPIMIIPAFTLSSSGFSTFKDEDVGLDSGNPVFDVSDGTGLGLGACRGEGEACEISNSLKDGTAFLCKIGDATRARVGVGDVFPFPFESVVTAAVFAPEPAPAPSPSV